MCLSFVDGCIWHYLQRPECICTEPVSPPQPRTCRNISQQNPGLRTNISHFFTIGMLLSHQIPKHKANWGCWHAVCVLFPYAFISMGQMRRFAELLYFRIRATKEVQIYHLSLVPCMHQAMHINIFYFLDHAIQCKIQCFLRDALQRFIITIQHHYGLSASIYILLNPHTLFRDGTAESELHGEGKTTCKDDQEKSSSRGYYYHSSHSLASCLQLRRERGRLCVKKKKNCCGTTLCVSPGDQIINCVL